MLLLTRGTIFDGMCRVILNGVYDERQLLLGTFCPSDFTVYRTHDAPRTYHAGELPSANAG
jgi:hypothetical protein